MRRPMLPLLAFLLLAASGGCAAQTVIHHCVAANGTPVFTDQSCASLGALPVARAGSPLTPRRAHGPHHCPLDIGDLRKRVAAAFRSRNANALAGLMLWRGYGQSAAADAVMQLAELMRSPFLGFADATEPRAPAPAASSWPPPLIPAGVATVPTPAKANILAIRFGDPAQPEVRFGIAWQDGCAWLEPPPFPGLGQP